ncbi:MAG TPA: hypothetical protein VGD81_17235 [Opitutaceae bacterium]
MKRTFAILAFLLSLPAASYGADEYLDRMSEALTFSALQDTVRARISGSLDLETYYMPEPVSDLVFNERDLLFNPRLLLFLDAQLGPRVYLFAQARIDRGFDPADHHLRLRLDEYALRYTPWDDGRLNLQFGQFATMIGNWAQRHLSWENPFIDAPLPYGNLTGIWDREAAFSVGTLLAWSHVQPASGGADVAADKDQRLPILWGPAYGTGVAVSGVSGRFEYALELKNVAPGARPESWSATEVEWRHPTVAGRVGWRPNVMWNLGLSASHGAYLHSEAGYELRPGTGLADYSETIVGHDLSFAWHHFQFWAEVYAARFEIPGLGDFETAAYYLEAKYKFTPRFFGAVRWNQQFFSEVETADRRVPWSRDVWRIDVAPSYRLTAHMQMKLQLSLRHEEPSPDATTHALSAQFTVRF